MDRSIQVLVVLFIKRVNNETLLKKIIVSRYLTEVDI